MDKKKALTIAMAAMKEQTKRFAVDANLHDHHGAEYPWAITASKRKKELEEAIGVLQVLWEETPLPTPSRSGKGSKRKES